MFKKLMVLAIIGFFIGSGVIPTIADEQNLKNSESIPNSSKSLDLNNSDIDWWSCFHHDIANSGFSSSYGPRTNEIRWIFEEMEIKSSPCVVNNKIYFGSPHLTSIPPPFFEGSFVFCLDEQGKEIWRYLTSGDLESTPAFYDDKIYIGSSEGQLLCLYANTGDLIWSEKTGGRIVSSPVVNDNRVLFGSYDESFYCLEANTGDILWSYKVDECIYSSPAIYGDNVYFGSLNGFIYCLDVYDGDLEWKFKTNDEIYSSPSLSNNKLFIGSADRNMYCLDASTGEEIWSCYVEDKIYQSSPTISNGNLFVGTSIGDIICFDSNNGKELWRFKTEGWVSSSPAAIKDNLYVGSHDHYFYCLDTETGDEVWRYKTKSEIESSPAIANGNVYIGCGRELYCFGNDEVPISDLDCEGTLYWTDIKPNSLITSNLTICNVGDPGSILNWKIESYPNWGEWTITPQSGTIASGNCKTVELFIIAPDIETSTFTGEILIINTDDTDDYEIITVSLTTPKNKERNHPFIQILNNHPHLFNLFKPWLS